MTQLSRSEIVINIKEKTPIGCLRYLDSYIYFDRKGIFVDSSRKPDSSVAKFEGLTVRNVVMDQELDFKGTMVLNTASTLASIFEKNESIPDYVEFDKNYQIILYYGDVTVFLGRDQFLEDKMARAYAILPQLEGRKGILHLESVTEQNKMITFEDSQKPAKTEEIPEWTGGYDEDGNYTGEGPYDKDGNLVGENPNASDGVTENDVPLKEEDGDEVQDEEETGWEEETDWEEEYNWEEDYEWEEDY